MSRALWQVWCWISAPFIVAAFAVAFFMDRDRDPDEVARRGG